MVVDRNNMIHNRKGEYSGSAATRLHGADDLETSHDTRRPRRRDCVTDPEAALDDMFLRLGGEADHAVLYDPETEDPRAGCRLAENPDPLIAQRFGWALPVIDHRHDTDSDAVRERLAVCNPDGFTSQSYDWFGSLSSCRSRSWRLPARDTARGILAMEADKRTGRLVAAYTGISDIIGRPWTDQLGRLSESNLPADRIIAGLADDCPDDTLRRLMHDPDPDVRATLAGLVDPIRFNRVVDPMCDPDSNVRVMCAINYATSVVIGHLDSTTFIIDSDQNVAAAWARTAPLPTDGELDDWVDDPRFRVRHAVAHRALSETQYRRLDRYATKQHDHMLRHILDANPNYWRETRQFPTQGPLYERRLRAHGEDVRRRLSAHHITRVKNQSLSLHTILMVGDKYEWDE